MLFLWGFGVSGLGFGLLGLALTRTPDPAVNPDPMPIVQIIPKILNPKPLEPYIVLSQQP